MEQAGNQALAEQKLADQAIAAAQTLENMTPTSGRPKRRSVSSPETREKSVSIITAGSHVLDNPIIFVEAAFVRGFAGAQLIGNASESCKSGIDRAKAALEVVEINLPERKMILNLRPADLGKQGSHFDLPMAVAMAALTRQRHDGQILAKYLLAAELGLDGCLRPVAGAVSMAISAIATGYQGMIMARGNLAEVAVLRRLKSPADRDFDCVGFEHISEVLAFCGVGDRPVVTRMLEPALPAPVVAVADSPDFGDMFLDGEQQRAAAVVGCGLHSLIMQGTPGTGKSMLAQRLTSVWPEMAPRVHTTALMLHSRSSSGLPESLLIGRPPVRSPHHKASPEAILGNERYPGELSLAHGGMLFLDELPEFRRDIIESLREPLETGHVMVARAKGRARWPAHIVLVAACNNCPCGWFGSKHRRCHCSSQKILAYRRKLSGPILDRFDIHLNMPEPDDQFQFLRPEPGVDMTRQLAADIERGREFGRARNQRWNVEYNCDLESKDIVAASGLTGSKLEELLVRVTSIRASSRSILRTVRVARTLADLRGDSAITDGDLQQAWQWQPEMAARSRGDEVFGGG